MQFQISSHAITFSARIPNPVDVDTTLPQRILQTNSVAIRPPAVDRDRVRSSKSRRTKQTPAESRTLLIGPVNQPDRNRWLALKIFSETAQHRQGGHNPQTPIQ